MTTNRLTPRARGLRQAGGLAEERIWARLRGGAVDGWKVRRQHPVGGYVLDFACVPLRQVIEIDSGVHERDEVVLNDHYRQQAIEALGWTVIRFTNAEALTEPARIDAAPATARRCWASNLPSPIGRGLERPRAQRAALRERVRVARRPAIRCGPPPATAHADFNTRPSSDRFAATCF